MKQAFGSSKRSQDRAASPDLGSAWQNNCSSRTCLTDQQIRESQKADGAEAHALFLQALNAATNEREIMPFLKGHPHVIGFSELHRGSHARYMFFEFPLGGSEYSADIVVLGKHSGAWCPTFIEVQSPYAKLFVEKSGNPSKDLAEGIRQIGEWKDSISRDESGFRDTLARKLPLDEKGADYLARMQSEIRDTHTHIEPRWCVLIGRSSKMEPKERERRRQASRHYQGIEILTFDRILSSLTPDG